jgi:DNA-binding NtrC family response regulator
MTSSLVGQEKPRALVVDNQQDMCNLLRKVIHRKCNCEVDTAHSADEGLQLVLSSIYDVVITDIKMPGLDGLDFLDQLVQQDATLSIILMTGYGTIEMAVQALRNGAYDFFEKPFDNEKIVLAVNRAVERTRLLRENRKLQQYLETAPPQEIIGNSPKIQRVIDLLARLAQGSATVLIRGESGTGKELAARMLHNMSSRRVRRMVTVNCPALPEHILESELFGYKKGAFTGAERDKDGLFLEANGSTILLDEIGDIPLSIQTKLLRVLQEKEIQPLGSTETIKVDVLVLASTNQDLEAKIARGEFRDDLFYRLNVMTVTMPSLTEIREDIPLLAHHFLKRFSKEYKREGLEFDADAMRLLLDCSWKGNARELENTINRTVLLSSGSTILASDILQNNPAAGCREKNKGSAPCYSHLSYKDAKERVLREFSSRYLGDILERNQGNISAAARESGMERQALQRLLRRYDMSGASFRS